MTQISGHLENARNGKVKPGSHQKDKNAVLLIQLTSMIC